MHKQMYDHLLNFFSKSFLVLYCRNSKNKNLDNEAVEAVISPIAQPILNFWGLSQNIIEMFGLQSLVDNLLKGLAQNISK